MRYTVARDTCARARYGNLPLERAAADVVLGELVRAGGGGGVIALDHEGHVAMPFNTPGMYRGVIRPEAVPRVDIYK